MWVRKFPASLNLPLGHAYGYQGAPTRGTEPLSGGWPGNLKLVHEYSTLNVRTSVSLDATSRMGNVHWDKKLGADRTLETLK